MPEIGAEIIPTPFPSASDYHLMYAERGPEAESFLFIPQSEAPGLTIDLIRVDLLPRRTQRLEGLFDVLLSQLISYAGPERARHAIVSSSPKDIVFHFSFAGHPMAGDQHAVGRLIDLGKSICGVQVLRKLEALTVLEVRARTDFVQGLQINLAALQARSGSLTDFVKTCLANTARMNAMFQRMATERKEPDDLAPLQQALRRASPLHATIEWASLAKIVAVDVLEQGHIEAFGTARRMLGLAVLNFDDARSNSGNGRFFTPKILNALDPLAELLLYEIEGDRRAHVQRAAGTWRLCAELEGDAELGLAAQFEVMASFAEGLSGTDLGAPLDVELGDATVAALQEKVQIERIVARLYSTASRMAHIARSNGRDRALLLGSCLSADLAQLLVERATALGYLDFDSYAGKTISIARWQIDAQMTLYGLSQADLDQATYKLEDRALEPIEVRARLAYLRPLGTARRGLIPNCFAAHVRARDERHRLLPDRISIEAALEVALTPLFGTQALGGPIDLFGMKRDTSLGGGADGWQLYAKLMIEHADVICVLPADSEGLSWELEEILRQGAAQKTIFVLPPRDGGTVPAISPAERERLGALGYTLPERIESGFLLMNADANCECQIPFECLWDGRLCAELLARLYESRQQRTLGETKIQ
jgi:hypothetical protein